jgi:hypothetical protein
VVINILFRDLVFSTKLQESNPARIAFQIAVLSNRKTTPSLFRNRAPLSTVYFEVHVNSKTLRKDYLVCATIFPSMGKRWAANDEFDKALPTPHPVHR